LSTHKIIERGSTSISKENIFKNFIFDNKIKINLFRKKVEKIY